jgi:hypothetical protein
MIVWNGVYFSMDRNDRLCDSCLRNKTVQKYIIFVKYLP